MYGAGRVLPRTPRRAHAATKVGRLKLTAVRRIGAGHFVFGARQGELKYRASRFIRICPQPAPMGIDDGTADRQPHPDSAGFRSVESLENPLDMLWINTWS